VASTKRANSARSASKRTFAVMVVGCQTAAGPRRRSWRRTVALFPCERVLYSREDPARSMVSSVTYRAEAGNVGHGRAR
jgi:hypothetical protein